LNGRRRGPIQAAASTSSLATTSMTCMGALYVGCGNILSECRRSNQVRAFPPVREPALAERD